MTNKTRAAKCSYGRKKRGGATKAATATDTAPAPTDSERTRGEATAKGAAPCPPGSEAATDGAGQDETLPGDTMWPSPGNVLCKATPEPGTDDPRLNATDNEYYGGHSPSDTVLGGHTDSVGPETPSGGPIVERSPSVISILSESDTVDSSGNVAAVSHDQATGNGRQPLADLPTYIDVDAMYESGAESDKENGVLPVQHGEEPPFGTVLPASSGGGEGTDRASTRSPSVIADTPVKVGQGKVFKPLFDDLDEPSQATHHDGAASAPGEVIAPRQRTRVDTPRPVTVKIEPGTVTQRAAVSLFGGPTAASKNRFLPLAEVEDGDGMSTAGPVPRTATKQTGKRTLGERSPASKEQSDVLGKKAKIQISPTFVRDLFAEAPRDVRNGLIHGHAGQPLPAAGTSYDVQRPSTDGPSSALAEDTEVNDGDRLTATSAATMPRTATGSMAAQLRAITSASTVTEAPADGYPVVHFNDPLAMHSNQSSDQLEHWETAEVFRGGKVIATVYGCGALDHLVDATRASAESLLTTALGKYLDCKVKVSSPLPVRQPTTLNAAPFCLLVHSISEEQAGRLLSMRCISTPEVSAFFFPLALQIPALVLSFGRLENKDDNDVEAMAVATLCHPDVLRLLGDIIRKHTPGTIDPDDLADILQRVIRSAWVESTPQFGKSGVPTPVYNLFLATPFESVHLWVTFANQLRAIRWGDHNLPHVTVREHVQCAGCHGHTHFYWACPFLKVPGWHGRMPEAVRVKMEGRAGSQTSAGAARGKDNANKTNRARA